MKEKWKLSYKNKEYSSWVATNKYPLKISNGKKVEIRIILYNKDIKSTQDNLDKLLEMGINFVDNNPKEILEKVEKERREIAEERLDELKDMKVFGLIIENKKGSDVIYACPEANLYEETAEHEGIAPFIKVGKFNSKVTSKENFITTSVNKNYNINQASSESFIKEMIWSGRIAVSEAAEDEFNEELDDNNEDNNSQNGGFLDEVNNNQNGTSDEESPENEEFADDGYDDQTYDEDMYLEEEVAEPEPEPVEKIHTIDTISQITNRFDQNMAQIGFDWTPFIINGRIKKAANFKYIEDMRTHLNKLFDDKKFRYVDVYNKLYDMMTDTNLGKSWNLFGRENFGKPYLAEGAALLMYELTVEWVPVIVRYYKESPVFSEDIAPEEDSFFKKFPNLNLLTYVAAIIVENKEFKKLLTSQKSKDLLLDESKYNLTAAQAKKKTSLRGLGESLSYYAGLVKENFGDITAGFLDKIAVVAFLSINTKMPMNDRLSLVERLIKIVTTNTTAVEPGQPDPLISALDTLNTTCTEFIKNRAEAKITLDSNEKNFPTVIIENANRM